MGLAGLRVLVTRPDPGGSELCSLIQDEEGTVIHLPTIHFASAPDLTLLEQQIEQLAEQQWLIFVSPQAVFHGLPLVKKRWPRLPQSLKVAAIGQGTAAALEKSGQTVDIYPNEAWQSEGLLALSPFQAVQQKKIALVKGLGGRDLLYQVLTERGAIVTSMIVYARIPATFNKNDYLMLAKKNNIDVIIAMSFDSIKPLQGLVSNIPLIVVSERIKILAYNLGFQTIWVTKSASNSAILQLLREKKDELCQIRMNQ